MSPLCCYEEKRANAPQSKGIKNRNSGGTGITPNFIRGHSRWTALLPLVFTASVEGQKIMLFPFCEATRPALPFDFAQVSPLTSLRCPLEGRWRGGFVINNWLSNIHPPSPLQRGSRLRAIYDVFNIHWFQLGNDLKTPRNLIYAQNKYRDIISWHDRTKEFFVHTSRFWGG